MNCLFVVWILSMLFNNIELLVLICEWCIHQHSHLSPLSWFCGQGTTHTQGTIQFSAACRPATSHQPPAMLLKPLVPEGSDACSLQDTASGICNCWMVCHVSWAAGISVLRINATVLIISSTGVVAWIKKKKPRSFFMSSPPWWCGLWCCSNSRTARFASRSRWLINIASNIIMVSRSLFDRSVTLSLYNVY